jgi:hypothetical protein
VFVSHLVTSDEGTLHGVDWSGAEDGVGDRETEVEAGVPRVCGGVLDGGVRGELVLGADSDCDVDGEAGVRGERIGPCVVRAAEGFGGVGTSASPVVRCDRHGS